MNRTLEDHFLYVIARWANVSFSSLCYDDLENLIDQISKHAYTLDKRHRLRTIQHLEIAFPDMTIEQRDELAFACIKNVVTLGFEVLSQNRMVGDSQWSDRMILGPGTEIGLSLLSQRKPAILATGHIGNWEILGQVFSQMGNPITSVARKLKHPKMSQWIFGIREKQGMKIVLKENATKHLAKDLENRRHVALVADQSAGYAGIFVPFFGKLASTFKSFSTLSLKYEVPIICGAAVRCNPWHYQIHIEDVIEPEECQKKNDPILYMTARYARSVEKMARKYPEQYFWMHRRWKTRPKFERDRTEMPATMREKLEIVEEELQLDNVA